MRGVSSRATTSSISRGQGNTVRTSCWHGFPNRHFGREPAAVSDVETLSWPETTMLTFREYE